MNKYEWASVMAQLIFGLLHAEDTLTLRVAGIMVDPFHENSPLSFRMGFMLKHLLISQKDPALSRQLLYQILRSCEIDPQIYDTKVLEDALIGLLYCERQEARNLLNNTKKPVKISIKGLSYKTPTITPPAPRAPAPRAPAPRAPAPIKGKGVGRPRKVIYKEEDGSDDEYLADQKAVLTTTTSKRGRPLGKAEYKEDPDVAYKPHGGGSKSRGGGGGRKSASNWAPLASTSAAGGQEAKRPRAARIRGPYKKSKKQFVKEVKYGKLKVKEILPWPDQQHLSAVGYDPNVLVEVNAELMDPLAMPDPSLENPLDVDIKTEVIEPLEVMSTMIEDLNHPAVLVPDQDSEDGGVSELLISSVAGNVVDENPLEVTDEQPKTNPLLEENPLENAIESINPLLEQNPIIENQNPLDDPDQDLVQEEDLGQNNTPEDSLDDGQDSGQDLAVQDSVDVQENPIIENQNPLEDLEQEVHDQDAVQDDDGQDGVDVQEHLNENDLDLLDDTNNEAESDDTTATTREPLAAETQPTQNNDACQMLDKVGQNGLTETSDTNDSNSIAAAAANVVRNVDPFSSLISDTFDKSDANSVDIDDPFSSNAEDSGSNNPFSTNHHDHQSVNNDPFAANAGSDNNGSSSDPFALENNINDLLQSNPLENGEISNPPALLDEDANELLDQLVDFQHHQQQQHHHHHHKESQGSNHHPSSS
jgi:hypothetical protein